MHSVGTCSYKSTIKCCTIQLLASMQTSAFLYTLPVAVMPTGPRGWWRKEERVQMGRGMVAIGARWTDQAQERGFGGANTHYILSHFSSLLCLHGSRRIFISNTTGGDPCRHKAAARAYLRASSQMSSCAKEVSSSWNSSMGYRIACAIPLHHQAGI